MSDAQSNTSSSSRKSPYFRLLSQACLRAAAVLAAGLLIGAIFARPTLGGLLALLIFVFAQLRQLARLRTWLMGPKRYSLPDASGIWGEVFDELIDLQRKNRSRKQRLALMLSEFQASTAALPDGAVVLRERGEIGWFNAAARQLLGLRAPQDLGIRIPNLIRHPSFQEFFESGDFEHETEAPSPINSGRTLSLRIIPYGNEQKLLIVRDVSERHQLEAARRDFVANASHELRTPLTVLRGYMDLMESDTHAGGSLQSWRAPIAEVRDQALRMEALVNDMLKLARMESDLTQTHDEWLQAPVLIGRAIEEARALSKGEHRIESEVAGQVLILGGETAFYSIVTNLVINAVRYTPEGGLIRVALEMEVGGAARFSVRDTGIGISAEDIPRLTERFYRVDVGRSRASGGTGLGLSIVKHALESFDSVLEITSQPGAGSTFFCRFPPHRVQHGEASDLTIKGQPAPVSGQGHGQP